MRTVDLAFDGEWAFGGLALGLLGKHLGGMIFRLAFALVASAVFAGEDAALEGRFVSNARQLIIEGKRSGEGYFSPDGKRMIFQSERDEGNPFYQMYVLDLESGETTRVSPGTGKTSCGFFQAGTGRVLFASTHEDAEAVAKQKAELEFRASGKQRRYSWDYDAAMDIFSANVDGTKLVNLTKSPGYDAEGAFSPDGRKIVFSSLRGAFPLEKLSAENRARYDKDPAWFGDIYIMDADGSNVRRLTNAPGYDGGPFFSPDGERILWRRFDASGMNADIFTMKLDGSDVRRLTDFKAMSWAPFFHPSGKYVVFTSNKLGFENFELFLVDAAGGREPVRVTFTPGFDGLPVFSPDGKKLSWASGRTSEGKSQIFLADWNHEAALKALEAAPKRAVPEKSLDEQVQELEKYLDAAAFAKPAGGAGGGASFHGGTIVHTPLGSFALPSVGGQQLQPEISAEDAKAEVSWLADEKRDGRGVGSEGARMAADWLAEYFKKAGVQPLPGVDGYFHPFEFNSGERVDAAKTALKINEGVPAVLDRDFRPLPFSSNEEARGAVVFAGYGLNVPEGTGQRRYNSYEGLDVKDKVVLILRYVPESVDAPRRAHLNRYAGLRYKVMMARERGAKGVLVVTGPNSPNAGELLPLSGDGSNADSGLPALSVSGAFADALLKPAGKTLKELQSSLDDENPHAQGGFAVPGSSANFSAGVIHDKKMDRNVIGYIKVKGATEWVIVGAHYDHLGRGKGSGSSLARAGEEGKIHPGADDNASGTAMVMEIAAALAKEHAEHPEKFRRNMAFALWSGEESGLLGSSAFVEKPPLDLKNVVAYINADMVGRLRENKLLVQAVGSSKSWPRIIEKRNVAAGFALTLQEDPYLPTDVTSFYPKRIPVLNFFTGSHEDYHRPTDTADKINAEGIARIATFAKGIVLDVAQSPERPEFSRVERKDQGGGRDQMRAYLGSIPDYATEVKGVKLSGVRADSPAEKAGLTGGDVIVEFAGQKIANIYDYTYALDAVKIGQPVKVIVEREGKRVEITATPEARK